MTRLHPATTPATTLNLSLTIALLFSPLFVSAPPAATAQVRNPRPPISGRPRRPSHRRKKSWTMPASQNRHHGDRAPHRSPNQFRSPHALVLQSLQRNNAPHRIYPLKRRRTHWRTRLHPTPQNTGSLSRSDPGGTKTQPTL